MVWKMEVCLHTTQLDKDDTEESSQYIQSQCTAPIKNKQKSCTITVIGNWYKFDSRQTIRETKSKEHDLISASVKCLHAAQNVALIANQWHLGMVK